MLGEQSLAMRVETGVRMGVCVLRSDEQEVKRSSETYRPEVCYACVSLMKYSADQETDGKVNFNAFPYI